MNPFHSLGIWLVSLLPPAAPEWAVGAAMLGGIYLALTILLLCTIPAAWYLERGGRS